MDVNKVTLIGNLTRKPEPSVLPSGQQCARFDVATKYVWTDQQSNSRRERTDFHTVIAYGSLAEIALRYVDKGSRLYIEGRLTRREWQGAQGQKHRAVEIVASEFILLSTKPSEPTPTVEPTPPA